MSPDGTAGARFATWWVETITRTAESATALDRRAEIASDVHEQLTDAWQRDASAAGSRAVVGRVVRGMPADLAWRTGLEIRPSRFAWHLRNPSTAITSLLVLLFPLNMAADAAWPSARDSFLDYRIPLWAATDIVGSCIVLFTVLALATRLSRRWKSVADRYRPQSRLERARRCATAVLGVSLAASAVLRFGPLDLASGAFWITFVLCVPIYLALVGATLITKALTLGRYLPKVRT